jgi:D-alanyl-D-alanine carboxypeptidase
MNETALQPTRRRLLAWGAGALPLALGGCGGNVNVMIEPKDVPCHVLPPLSTAVRGPVLTNDFPAPYLPPGDELNPLPATARLNAEFDRLFATVGAVAIDAALLQPGIGLWSRRAGQRGGGQAVGEDTEFWWASCGKALTASLVLQAEQTGLLRLSDPVSRWRPDMPRAEQTTILQLMQHLSGYLSYNHPIVGIDATDRYRSPTELLDLVRDRSTLNCPGLGFAYSNTNYLILALVLESVWARPFHELLNTRISQPLGLSTLRALAPREQAERLALAHDAQGRSLTQVGLSSLVGAGNVLGSAADWTRVWQALLNGRLAGAPEPRFAPLLQFPAPDLGLYYGRGAMVIDWRDNQGRDRTWLAHTGGSREGYNAVVFWDTRQRVYGAVVSSNRVPAAAMGNALLAELERST